MQPRLEARDQLREAAHELADADSENDDAYALCDAKLARTAVRYATSFIEALRQNEQAERRKEARARALRAMRKGVRYGVPPKLERLDAEHAVRQAGGIRAAARLLNVSPAAVVRALRRKPVSPSQNPKHGALHSLAPGISPPEGGGSEES